MENTSFNLHQTLGMIGTAIEAVVCHMLFDFALHGIILAALLIFISFCLSARKYAYAGCVGRVAKRMVIFCLVLALPGVLSLIINHQLPPAGVFSFNSIGLLCVWSLISVHLVFEEINSTIIKPEKVRIAKNDS